MITFLQNYLQINTSHPTPQYDKAIELFVEQAKKDKLDYTVITLPSKLKALVVSLRGTDKSLPAIGLNHHMDTVPAPNANDWLYAPFSGAIADGKIYGRGAQDMKGIGVAQYFALKKRMLYGENRLTRHRA